MKNYTPHSITIIDPNTVQFDSSIRKYVATNPKIIKTIPSVGILNAKIETQQIDKKDEVTIYHKTIKDIDPLPETNEIIIVSALYALAVQKINPDKANQCYTIADPVYNKDGTTVLGCLGICKSILTT